MNKVANWQYDKPTEDGIYLVSDGDVETHHSIQGTVVIEGDKHRWSNNYLWKPNTDLKRSFKYAIFDFNDD